MADQRLDNEKKHLLRLKVVLDKDAALQVRFEIIPLSLDYRTFRIVINGIKSLIFNPQVTTKYSSSSFNTIWRIPSGYPWEAIPNIQFENPIPFHPHVWKDGRICWGTQNKAQPDYVLADWLRCLIEYLAFNQNSLIQMNTGSPANSEANDLWKSNKSIIQRNISVIDMNRLRFWIDHSRG